MRVLIVEDENTTRRLLTEVLRSRGHDVTPCPDAETAWDAFRSGTFPLVLVNWMLPGMTGLDLCRRIRRQPTGSETVIVVITGRVESGALGSVLEAGADDYLPKPIDVAGLNIRLAIAERSVENIQAKLRAEAERRSLEARMVRSERFESLGILAGNIAHDFNNKMVSVLGFAEFARQDDAAGKPVTRHLDHIETAARRACDLTNQLLMYSGRKTPNLASMNLNDVAPDPEDLMPFVNGGGARVELHLADRELPVTGDPTQLRQVVFNLVRNGIDAIGGNAGRVRVSSGLVELQEDKLDHSFVPSRPAAGSYAYVEVSDDGAGMDRETRQQMFDPCFTTKDAGFGLGLAVAVGIISNHQGGISVRSAPGQGTTIRVLLPVEPDAQCPAGPAGLLAQTAG